MPCAQSTQPAQLLLLIRSDAKRKGLPAAEGQYASTVSQPGGRRAHDRLVIPVEPASAAHGVTTTPCVSKRARDQAEALRVISSTNLSSRAAVCMTLVRPIAHDAQTPERSLLAPAGSNGSGRPTPDARPAAPTANCFHCAGRHRVPSHTLPAVNGPDEARSQGLATATASTARLFVFQTLADGR